MSHDVVIIGAGFGGLYALKRMRDDLGLNVTLVEQGSGPGGTWYWNRYPGAMSDTRSHLYCYSFDKELLLNEGFSGHYRLQPEILAYLERFVDKFDLARSIHFNTELTSAIWNDEASLWELEFADGEQLSARYIVTALGLLSKPNIPNIKGIDSFEGKVIHTARWPEGATWAGKRVGVIGTGSTGVQVITAIAGDVEHLTVFQRSAQYSVPSGQGPIDEEHRNHIRENYDKIWQDEKSTLTVFGAKESNISVFSVTPEEREVIFEDAWNEGGGFRFMFGTFNDLIMSEEANEFAQDFIRRKIRGIVKDPKMARKLSPTDLYAKRPLCDAGYYAQFNRDNVSLVDVTANPISEITPKGIKTEDGTEHELDMLIFATGFEAVDGNYLRLNLQGRNGVSIQDHWRDGPVSFLGIFTSNFPNMFMVLGPNSPFSNLPPAIELQVDVIVDVLAEAIRRDAVTVETRQQAQEIWVEACRELAENTILPRAKSWIFGANIPGKPYTLAFYMAGYSGYKGVLKNFYEGSLAELRFTDEHGGEANPVKMPGTERRVGG